jgi:hypothetical protein
VSGRVVDEHGVPVAGATVVAGDNLAADAIDFIPRARQRRTTSGPDGTFELAAASQNALIVAELADRRSSPENAAESVTLKLEPTSSVEGRVELRGEPPTNVTVFVRDPKRASVDFTVIAPARSDGTFVLERVLRGNKMVHVQVSRASRDRLAGAPVVVAGPVVRGVVLEVPRSNRVIHVVVRSTAGIALSNAEVFVMAGKAAPPNAAELLKTFKDLTQRVALPIEGERAPASVRKLAKRGDVYATVSEAPEGPATACAIPLPNEISDPDLQQKVSAHPDKIEVRCVPIGEHDEVELIEIPPWPRFD